MSRKLSCGLRMEIKRGERRTALIPSDARLLVGQGVRVGVQRWNERCYSDPEYVDAGAELCDSLEGFDVQVATKEFKRPPSPIQLHRDTIAVGFHHAHKGQADNLPILKEACELGVSMFDYELFRPGGIQPITTSRYAGLAGAYNGLWAVGQLRKARGRVSKLSTLPAPGHFGTTAALVEILHSLTPPHERLRAAVVGTGGCGQGARATLLHAGMVEVPVAEARAGKIRSGSWFTMLGSADIVKRRGGGPYNRDEFHAYGAERYESIFEQYLDSLGFDLVVYTPYWEEKQPRLMPLSLIHERRTSLPVISDVTCDIGGSIEATLQSSTIDSPVWSYCPDNGRMEEGIYEHSAVITAVDNLPSQLARSCSDEVSGELTKALATLLDADLSMPLERSGLPTEFQAGFITWRGELTEPYRHLATLL